MKTNRLATLACSILIAGSCSAALAATSPANNRDRSFDSDWRFLRADAPGAETPGLDDSGWRTLDVPHDWSIDDLPALEKSSVPELSVTPGEWRFQKGDEPAWKARDFDDRGWQSVVLPGAGWPASVGIEAAARRQLGQSPCGASPGSGAWHLG